MQQTGFQNYDFRMDWFPNLLSNSVKAHYVAPFDLIFNVNTNIKSHSEIYIPGWQLQYLSQRFGIVAFFLKAIGMDWLNWNNSFDS